MKKLLLFIGIISWSYTINAQCDSNLPVIESFDTNTIDVCWNTLDQDGDGYKWYWREYLPIYGGYKCLVSRSYNTADGALTPDNWVISFPIDLTSYSTNDNLQLSWKVRGEYSNFSHEYYSVYAATNNQISNFTSSPVVTSEYADAVGGTGTFVTRSMNLSSLAGNVVYIAFRHYNSTNQYSINIDDVSVSTSILGVDDFDQDSFKHFYNTQNNQLTLKSSTMPLNGVKIYNLLGQNVMDKKLSITSESLDLSNLVDGIYIAQVTIDNSTKAIKFLKQ